MRRFIVDPASIKEGLAWLSPRESAHALQVLRLKSGDPVELLDGKGLALQGKVVEIRKGQVGVRVLGQETGGTRLPQARITLAVSVIKPERMEQLIEKACELGVEAIVPLRTQRTVVKLSAERWDSKITRFRKIAAEACKQCGLPRIPQISPVADFKPFLDTAGGYDGILLPTLSVRNDILYNVLDTIAPGRILALIGPEGDFSQEEAEWAVAKGARPVSLGPLVLRSETAAWSLLTAVQFYYREVRGGTR